MSKIKVSVIVPVFNKEKYLGDCLDSLINQTLEEIEVICVDDGSSDGSASILEEYSCNDSRIKVFRQENGGPGSARNKALKKAAGKYVLFVDADDWIEQDTAEALYLTAEKYGSEIVLFNATEYLPQENYRERIYYTYDIYESFNFRDRMDIVMNNYLIVCTKLHKLSFIRENSLSFSESSLFEDVFFHIKSMVLAENVSYVNRIFYNYRRTENNTRQSNSIRSRESFFFLDVLRDVKSFLTEEGVFDILRENFYTFKLTETRNLFENNDEKESFYVLLKEDFTEDKIAQNILEKLPEDKRIFYLNIINSTDYKNYIKLSNPAEKKKESIFDRIIHKILH